MRGKSFVRIKAREMHCSGPRSEIAKGFTHGHVVPYFTGEPQLSWAVPAGELPDG